MTSVVDLLRAELGDRVDTSAVGLDDARADKSGHRSAAPGLAVVHAAALSALLVDPPARPSRGLLPEACASRGLYWGGEAPVAEAEQSDTVLINVLRA